MGYGNSDFIHRFSVPVDCVNMTNFEGRNYDNSKWYNDCGFIILPEKYSEKGEPVRWVIFCHGAGGDVSVNDSQVENMTLAKYLVANGYAVMDVNGLPYEFAAEKGIDIRNNIGSPIAVQSYARAYRYCADNFNLQEKPIVYGGSMGGISGTNLVMSGLVPVLIHGCLCPVLDTYNEIFLHPWSGGLPKTALGIIYGFEKNEDGYVYDESKVRGYNPVKNALEIRDGLEYVSYPVPVRFWQCTDDGVVSCEITQKFVDAVRRNGGEAYLRTFEHGGHEPQESGVPVENPHGVSVFKGEQLSVYPAMEETLLWFEQYGL